MSKFAKEASVRVDESIFSKGLLDLAKSHLADGLSAELTDLVESFKAPEVESDLVQTQNLLVTVLATQKILVEVYGQNPRSLIESYLDTARCYKQNGQFEQSYYHYIQALQKFKLFAEILKDPELGVRLFIKVCKACCQLKSFREAYFYLKELKTASKSPKNGQFTLLYLQDNTSSYTEAQSRFNAKTMPNEFKILFLEGLIKYKLSKLLKSSKLLSECFSKLGELEEPSSKGFNFYLSQTEGKRKIYKLKLLTGNNLFKIVRKQENYQSCLNKIDLIITETEKYAKVLEDLEVNEIKLKFLLRKAKIIGQLLSLNTAISQTKDNSETINSLSQQFLACIKNLTAVVCHLVKVQPASLSVKSDIILAKTYDFFKQIILETYQRNPELLLEIVGCMEQLYPSIKDTLATQKLCCLIFLKTLLMAQEGFPFEQVLNSIAFCKKQARQENNLFIFNKAQSLYAKMKEHQTASFKEEFENNDSKLHILMKLQEGADLTKNAISIHEVIELLNN